ncbi:MAG: TonB-dependent receptor [Hyphomonadaceae bacterium]|nr:TonB-dependent receptor [Hyphomonadaceae bacterium]
MTPSTNGKKEASGPGARRRRGLGWAALLASVAVAPFASATAVAQTATDEAAPERPRDGDTVIVTARRQSEDLQAVPIPVSVVSGQQLADSGVGSVLKIEELVPSIQIFSSNPRNTALNIRGLGTTFGLTNDGVEVGVGLYVDGVFWSRPAQAALDFIDVEQVEVLRGPQGTLYGKNTTAGAINITTRRPDFTPETEVELSYGNYGFLSTKASITGPVWGDRIAGRLSFSGTQRDGFLTSVAANNRGDDLNDANNLGVRGQLLFQITGDLEVLAAVDHTRQRPEGYAQVPVRVAPTFRTANRQFFGIIDSINATTPGLNYAVPTRETARQTITNPSVGGIPVGPNGIFAEFDAFARITDADVPHRSYQDINGQSITVNWDIGPGTLTSITAHRHWEWYPANDRDFIGIPITTASNNRSGQDQWTQELRYAGELSDSLSFVVGAYYFDQEIRTKNTQSQGRAAARFLIDPRASNVFTGADGTTLTGNVAAFIPELLDGLTQIQNVTTKTTSAALFGQVEWSVTDRLRLIPGIRFNYDEKSTDYDSPVTGGLNPASRPDLGAGAIRAAQNSILSRQTYAAQTDDTNTSGQLTIAYDVAEDVNAYATYATSFKSFGLNVAGVPANTPVVVKPESVTHYELGLKTKPFDGATLNIAAFNTDIDDYQTVVVANVIGTLRGYLANAEQVRVRGVEVDASARVTDAFSVFGAVAYTDAKYVRFPNSPLPIEETGRPIPNPAYNAALPTSASNPLTITAPFTDVSGKRLPGVSEWAGSFGAEYVLPSAFLGREGEYFLAGDVNWRTDFSSDPAGSRYMEIEGYSLLNGRIGFRTDSGWDFYVWGRNLADAEYYEILATASGGSGLVVGSLGDPRTFGVTLRGRF